MNLSDYDYPMSYGCYRALCQFHGKPVPPAIVVYPEPLTEAEDKAQFIKWQDNERRGLPQRVKPTPMQSKPSVPQIPKEYVSKGGDGGGITKVKRLTNIYKLLGK